MHRKGSWGATAVPMEAHSTQWCQPSRLHSLSKMLTQSFWCRGQFSRGSEPRNSLTRFVVERNLNVENFSERNERPLEDFLIHLFRQATCGNQTKSSVIVIWHSFKWHFTGKTYKWHRSGTQPKRIGESDFGVFHWFWAYFQAFITGTDSLWGFKPEKRGWDKSRGWGKPRGKGQNEELLS